MGSSTLSKQTFMFKIGFIVVMFFANCPNGFSQKNNKEDAMVILDKISETYDAKLNNIQFSIESIYSYSCSDSVIISQRFDYWIRKGEYYIEFENSKILILDDFFLKIDNDNEKIIYCREPLLDHNTLTSKESIKVLRENVIQSSLIKYDTIGDTYQLTMILAPSQIKSYNRVELFYDANYQFKEVIYYDADLQEKGLFQLPNCLRIVYSREHLKTVKKDPFNKNNYIKKKGESYFLVGPYKNYVLTEQIIPHE